MLVKPVALAKKLGIAPQVIYGLIRRGKLASRVVNGHMMVEEEQTRAVINMLHKRPSADGSVAPARPVPVGTIVSWERRPDKPNSTRRVLRLREYGKHLVRLEDTKGKHVECAITALADKIRAGQIAIEEPWQLLEFIALQWEHTNNSNLAKELRSWVEQHRKEVQ